jgi:hypothetical protein
MIAGRPSPRLRQKAPQSGGVKPLRSSPKGAEPRTAGPGGTFGHGASGNAAGGLRAPQTLARYLHKKIGRPFDGFLSP